MTAIGRNRPTKRGYEALQHHALWLIILPDQLPLARLVTT